MKVLKPILAAAIFFFLTVGFTYYFNPSVPNVLSIGGHIYGINIGSHSYSIAIKQYSITITPFEGYFISSPFNMQTEGNPLYNLILPTILIFLLGVYLKNFNNAFQRKCNLRSVFIMAIIASYIKSWGSMLYYKGYSDFGISLGTSIITLCFLAAFVISLEVYIERKEKYEHLYGHFMFAVLSCLIMLLAILIFFSFFASSSFIVHAMGLTAFLIMFIPFYERDNIRKFMKREERAIASIGRRRTAAAVQTT